MSTDSPQHPTDSSNDLTESLQDGLAQYAQARSTIERRTKSIYEPHSSAKRESSFTPGRMISLIFSVAFFIAAIMAFNAGDPYSYYVLFFDILIGPILLLFSYLFLAGAIGWKKASGVSSFIWFASGRGRVKR